MTEGIELPNQQKIRTHREKETYKYLGILEADTIKHAEMKENIFKIPQENDKATQNQTISQESHQSHIHLGRSLRKILRTILKVDEGRISTNGLENKETIDDA